MCLSFRKFRGWMGSLGLGKEKKYQAWHTTKNVGSLDLIGSLRRLRANGGGGSGVGERGVRVEGWT